MLKICFATLLVSANLLFSPHLLADDQPGYEFLIKNWNSIFEEYASIYIETKSQFLTGEGVGCNGLKQSDIETITQFTTFVSIDNKYYCNIRRIGDSETGELIDKEEYSYDGATYMELQDDFLRIRRGLPPVEVGSSWSNPLRAPFAMLLGPFSAERGHFITTTQMRTEEFVRNLLYKLPLPSTEKHANKIILKFAFPDDEPQSFGGRKISFMRWELDSLRKFFPTKVSLHDENNKVVWDYRAELSRSDSSNYLTIVKNMTISEYCVDGQVLIKAFTEVIDCRPANTNDSLTINLSNVSLFYDEDLQTHYKLNSH